MTRFSLLRNAALGANPPRPIISPDDINGCRTEDDFLSYTTSRVAPIKRTYPRIHGGAAPPPHPPFPAQFTAPVLSPGHGDAGMQMLVYLLGLVSIVLAACVLYVVFA